MRVACVLRSGGEYNPRHAVALASQVKQHLPGAELICLSDVQVPGVQTIPLEHKWPGWWSKMELFSPKIEGDLLYFDLDTVILGDISEIIPDKLTLLRDFYRDGLRREEGLQSSMMYLPEEDRAEVWDVFARNPARAIMEYFRGGDQAFLEKLYMDRAERWQDVHPGVVVSYKVHCRKGVPEDAKVICFHGRPRPWTVPEYKRFYE